jgi:hypothetical protein
MRGEDHDSELVQRLVAAMSQMEGALRGRVREGQRDDFMEVGRKLMREMSVPGFED